MANEFSDYSFLRRFFMEFVYLHFVRNEFFNGALRPRGYRKVFPLWQSTAVNEKA